MANDYTETMIQNRPMLIGNPPIQKLSFAGVNPGEYIIQVGHKIESSTNKTGTTSSNRLDRFPRPVQYAGIYKGNGIYGPNEKEDFVAIKLGDLDVAGWKQESQRRDVYALYIIIAGGQELVIPTSDQSLRMYKPVFEKVNIDPQNIMLADWCEKGTKISRLGIRCEQCPFRPQHEWFDFKTAAKPYVDNLLNNGTVPKCLGNEEQPFCFGYLNAKSYLREHNNPNANKN